MTAIAAGASLWSGEGGPDFWWALAFIYPPKAGDIVMVQSGNRNLDAAEAFDVALEDITLHNGTDTCGCAGVDHVARLNIEKTGEIFDGFRHVPD